MANTIANVLVGIVTVSINPTAGSAIGAGGWVDLGYTVDGVQFRYTAQTENIRVLAETFPVKRIIRDEDIDVICNLAEASLLNINYALAGGVLATDTITLDAGAVKELALKLVGTGTNGSKPNRTIYVPYCSAVGAVRQPYRKAAITVTPVTFRALKSSGVDVCTIEDTA